MTIKRYIVLVDGHEEACNNVFTNIHHARKLKQRYDDLGVFSEFILLKGVRNHGHVQARG